MSGSLYGYSQSNNSYTIALPLADGTYFPVIYAYNEPQSKAVVVSGYFFYCWCFRSHQSHHRRHLSLRLAFLWSLLSDSWLRSLCVLT